MDKAIQFLHAIEKQETISSDANGMPQNVDIWINAGFVNAIEFIDGCLYASTYDACYLVDDVADLEGIVTGQTFAVQDDDERRKEF